MVNGATITIHQRPGELDRLSEAVLASWQRPVSRPLYRGSLWILLATAFTLGLWPLFKARRWLRDYAAVRDQRCWQTTEWFRVSQIASIETAPVRSVIIRPNALLQAFVMILLILAICVLFNALRTHHLYWGSMYGTPTTLPQQAFTMLIVGAAVAEFLQLLDHHHQFNRFLGELNSLLAQSDLPPVRPVSIFRLNGFDWIGGLLLSSGGAIWPLLIIVIVGLQRSYIRRNVRVHVQIGDRMRDILAIQTPPLRLPPRHDLLERCANLQCGAPLPRASRFCPRCGNMQNEATAARYSKMSNEATAVHN